MDADVVIVGGGPAGATTGSLIKKYAPELRVLILEREQFPREHVGESQLPGCSTVLDEMGCWDKVEAANFPIKVGATYRWGKTHELWNFEFFPPEQFEPQERPGRYEGQRRATAFQVDRAIYDKILLDHAASLGCEVREQCRVLGVDREGDRITGLRVSTTPSASARGIDTSGGRDDFGPMGDVESTITARHYVDASGHGGAIRRNMGVQIDCPTKLQNIAIWEYWENADWAIEIGVGGTFIQILSVEFGWLWFIPLGPTRTSVGLVVPAAFYKSSGMKPEELYARALKSEPRIQGLMKNATPEGLVRTTKDWSFLADRQTGDNWYLVGEASGFADPILSAGMTMAHAAGRELACTILEIERSPAKADWIKSEYAHRQTGRIGNHIRFADYWYSANGIFSELKEHTSEIARDSGLDLTPDKAWAWIAQGGFIADDLTIGTGTFSLNALKALSDVLTDVEVESPFDKYNVFKLDLAGASWSDRARFGQGRVLSSGSYLRDGRVLPIDGIFEPLVAILQRETTIAGIVERLNALVEPMRGNPQQRSSVVATAISALEALVLDGWIKAEYDPAQPLIDLRVKYRAIKWDQSERQVPTPS